MDTEEIWNLTDDAKTRQAELLDGLTEAEWDKQSLCGDWRVRDVVAHQILSTKFTLPRVAIELVRARGDVNRLIRDTAIRLGSSPTPRLLSDFRSTIGSRFTPPKTTPIDRLMDVLVHSQDIAVPLGLQLELPPVPTRVALERVWAGSLFEPQKKFAGRRLVATDIDWTEGSGAEIRGPIGALLMLTTGRTALADELTGEGVTR